MAASSLTTDFLACVQQSNLLSPADFTKATTQGQLLDNAQELASWLISQGLLTTYQAKLLLSGKHKGFFLGQYKILEPIGKGGMGAIYLAHHMTLNRKVALKILPKENAKNPLELERFHREARTAALLNHPNVVRVSDVAQSNGLHFLVMEYVEGVTLQQILDRSGALSSEQAVKFIIQAAIGLQAAHDAGLVHRDIKPANLILDKAGTLKILDFGLARSTDNASDHLTEKFDEGSFAGTADFVSPEQAMCQPTDHRSDVYSLGATLFVLLTGRPPFEGTITQKLLAHQVQAVPEVSRILVSIPPNLSVVIRKMMAKSPDDRFASMTEVVEALRDLKKGAGVRLSPPAQDRASAVEEVVLVEPIDERPSRPLWGWILAGVGGCLLLALMIVIGLSLGTPPTPAPEVVAAPEPVVKEKPKVVVFQPKREPLDGTQLPDIVVNWQQDVPARMALTPEGRQLVVSGAKTVGVWQLPEAAFLGHFDMVQDNKALAISPDGATVVVGTTNTGMVRARDLASNTQIWEADLPGSQAWTVTFLPDGKRVLVTHAKPNVARILDAKSGRELFRFGIGEAHFAQVSNDGTKVLIPSFRPHQVGLYEINTGKRLQVVNTHDLPRTAVMTADQKTVIVGGGPWKGGLPGSVAAYDLATNKQIQQFGKGVGISTLHILAISPNDQYVAGCTFGKEIYLWETKTGKLIAKYDHQKGHGMGIAFSPDSKRILSTAQDKTVRSWVVGRNLPDTPENTAQAPKRTLIARFDAASLPEFRSTVTLKRKTNEVAANEFPKNWTSNAWREGDEAERSAQELDGRRVLTLRNMRGFSGQLYSNEKLFTQRPGMRYVVQLRYQLESPSQTRLELRKGRKSDDKLAEYLCLTTNNGFSLLEGLCEGKEDLELFVFLVHLTPAAPILIDSIDLYEESLL
jgi:tRNA A-37 threonylcarbamoyl transferase component Bud32/DNA-binding beta-propeller fold protein YncE